MAKRGAIQTVALGKRKNGRSRDYAENKEKAHLDFQNMTPQEQLKFEIAQELGLGDQVIEKGWRSLTAKESGKIGGLMTKRKRELKQQAMGEENEEIH